MPHSPSQLVSFETRLCHAVFLPAASCGRGLALLSLSAVGQDVAPASLPAISSLRLLTQNSGYIFDGTVLS